MSEQTESLIGARRLARMLTEPVCRNFGLLPIALHDDVVTVAVSETSDQLAPDIAKSLLGREVVVRQWTRESLDRALDAVFSERSKGLAEPAVAVAANGNGNGNGTTASAEPALGLSGHKRIGEALIDLGLITPDQMYAALDEQERTGSRLGEILVSSGAVSDMELLAALGEQFRLQHVDLSGHLAEAAAVNLLPESLVRELRCVPLAADGQTLYVAVADPLSEERLQRLSEQSGLEVKEMLATRNSIEDLIARIYQDDFTDIARNQLLENSPENSANQVLTTAQRIGVILTVLVIIIAFVISPHVTAVVLVSVASAFYLFSSIYKAVLIYRSLGHGAYIDVTDEELAEYDERNLPVYTILVPLYKEAAVVPRLLAGIGNLDYPHTKLDVRLLCEEDDDETIAAIRALDPPPYFKLVIVPDSQPRTKPKACNYGILQADGQYVVIYDAEDRPDPTQLKRAVIAFEKGPTEVTCLQAKLNYFNTHQNLLTRWFSIEYSMHFDLLLPGLCAVRAPIPLGGTSNHFRLDRLRELGAWDPYNVTEDADLGIRLYKAGYTTMMIESTTLEEANSSVNNWIRQRSRWIKGYYQTWLVHMRNPARLFRQLGPRGFMSFNLVVGGSFIFLLNPIFWALTTVFLFTHAGFIQSSFPSYVFYVAAIMLFIGNFLFTFFNVAGSLQSGNYDLTRYALFSPFYWGLMSWAAVKAFWQLIYRPFYWEKTTHGLDTGHHEITPVVPRPLPAAHSVPGAMAGSASAAAAVLAAEEAVVE